MRDYGAIQMKKALIIGISRYDKLQALDLCENDAKEISDVLVKQGYEILDNHRLIGYVTHQTMRQTIRQFFKGNKREDTLLLYFSGHGLPDGTGKHYLAPSDIDPDDPFDKGIDFESLQYIAENSNSSKRLTILDCCFSGAVGLDGVKGENEISRAKSARDVIDRRMKRSEGTYLLASSLAFQQSLIKKDLGHSLFTYYLLEGLKGKEGYKDSAGYVTADLLHNYIFDNMTEKDGMQRPIKKARISGDIAVAYYPPSPKPKQEEASLSRGLSYEEERKFTRKLSEAEDYEKDGDYDNAIFCYKEALKIDPNYHRPYNKLGKALFINGRDDDAIRAFEGAIAADPEHPDAYNSLGDIYFEKRDYNEALKWYDKALNLRKSSEFLKDKGRALYELKDYGQAIVFFEEALEIKSGKKEVLNEVLKYSKTPAISTRNPMNKKKVSHSMNRESTMKQKKQKMQRRKRKQRM